MPASYNGSANPTPIRVSGPILPLPLVGLFALVAGGSSSEVDFSGYGGAADLVRVRLVRTGETRILDLRPEAADPDILQLLVQSGDWLHVPPQPTSRWRSNLQLLSGIFSVAGSIAALVILIGG